MRPNITITIPTPYLPIDEYCRITGTPMGTARDMVRDGRFLSVAKVITPRSCRNQHGCADRPGIKRMSHFASSVI